MKKVLSLILATLLVLTSVAALAEAVPSKTTGDLASVKEVVAENGTGVSIVIVEANDAVLKIMTEAVEAILNGTDAVAVFNENTQKAIAEKVGDKALALNEMHPIEVIGYTDAHGAVTATFELPTKYTAEQTLVAVACVFAGGVDEEFVMEAVANEDGTVKVSFPADVLKKIVAGEDTVLSILNTK